MFSIIHGVNFYAYLTSAEIFIVCGLYICYFSSVLSQSEPEHDGEGEIIQVKMNKGVTGVGFVIQGGKGSPKGDKPITIKRIFKGKQN